jgi:Ala-tRNA(Pro) deacylase
MPVKKLKEFLDSHGVKYVTLSHSRAFTAQDVAESSHVSGKELAKTVVVLVDGRPAMAVVPAASRVDLDLLKQAAGAGHVELAGEKDFKGMFPECELGAMPPFGNLYGLPTFASDRLARQAQIAFSAGTHTEVIRLPYADFERLVMPRIATITAD